MLKLKIYKFLGKFIPYFNIMGLETFLRQNIINSLISYKPRLQVYNPVGSFFESIEFEITFSNTENLIFKIETYTGGNIRFSFVNTSITDMEKLTNILKKLMDNLNNNKEEIIKYFPKKN